jgi:hypothetical protein
MTDSEREELIRASIASCVAKGVKLGIQSWGLHWVKSKERWVPKKDATCCPLSCVLLANQGDLRENEVSWRSFSLEKLLGANTNWVRSFQYGFDGYTKTEHDEENAYMLGALFRRELVK